MLNRSRSLLLFEQKVGLKRPSRAVNMLIKHSADSEAMKPQEIDNIPNQRLPFIELHVRGLNIDRFETAQKFFATSQSLQFETLNIQFEKRWRDELISSQDGGQLSKLHCPVRIHRRTKNMALRLRRRKKRRGIVSVRNV